MIHKTLMWAVSRGNYFLFNWTAPANFVSMQKKMLLYLQQEGHACDSV